MTGMERSKLLWKLADLIEKNFNDLSLLETTDKGGTLAECRMIDMPVVMDWFRYYSGSATKIEGRTINPSASFAPGAQWFAYTQRQPVGVVGAIIPWNFPLVMASWKLAPALAAGCTVVLKPAEQAPLSCLRLGELICEAGFPPGVVNIVNGYGETAGAALTHHMDVDKIAFTGSTEVGKLVVKASQESNLKRVSLELGGKSPNVIFADADIKAAIGGAMGAIFFHQGQVCVAGSRLFVEKKVHDQVVEALVGAVKTIKVGNGLDPASNMGPLVSSEQQNRVCGYIESGKQQGAKVAVGGSKLGDKGFYVQPTIFTDVKDDMKIMQEEIFGPVLAASSFNSLEEVLPRMNSTQYGLASGVWTADANKARKVADHLKAGTVWVNCYNIFDPSLPFGGFKQSGWGRENGREEVLEMYTEGKTIIMPR